MFNLINGGIIRKIIEFSYKILGQLFKSVVQRKAFGRRRQNENL